MNVDKLKQSLEKTTLVQEVVHFSEVASTNDYAKKECNEGILVVAGEQSAGKGRAGNTWLSSRGKGIYMSFNYKTKLSPLKIPRINLAVSVAISKMLTRLNCNDVKIKWPNDIFVNEKKIAGILIETSITGSKVSMVTIGIGINTDYTISELDKVNPYYRATSILEETAVSHEHERIISLFFEELEKTFNLLSDHNFEKLAKYWWAYSIFKINDIICYRKKDSLYNAVVNGIDDSGLLKVKSEGIISLLTEAEISLVEVNNVTGN